MSNMVTDSEKILVRLHEITRKLGTAEDLAAYLQSILSAAAELTESETASMLEYEEASQELYFKVIPWFHREAVKNARIPLNGSIAGWIYQNAKPVILDDARQDDRHYGKIDELTGFVTKSLLGVPLLLRGKPIGVIEVFNKSGEVNYTEEDLRILEILASLAAIAIRSNLLESDVHSLHEETRELERLKNEFIGITSHELRTPLGLILGHATFLRELTGDEYAEQVDAIIRNASRLKEIIESLSSVDNYQTGLASLRNRKVSITRVIGDVIASFRGMAAEKGVALKAEFPKGEELLVDVDSAKIVIALSNLVKNAIAFTNKDGHVTIRGELQPGFVKVVVEDDGVGIPAKDLPRIFERFYQVESHLTRKHGGMGLGLSVAKVMVEMHGGRIWAESVEGSGSTFTFLLPVDGENNLSAPSQPFVSAE